MPKTVMAIALLIVGLFTVCAFFQTSVNDKKQERLEPVGLQAIDEETTVITNEENIDMIPTIEPLHLGSQEVKGTGTWIEEFENGDFINIERFHDLVSFCSAIPRNEEGYQEYLQETLIPISDEEMINLMKECSNVLEYDPDYIKYYIMKGIESGSESSMLSYAKLYPFITSEAIGYLHELMLSQDKRIAQESLELLTMHAVRNEIDFQATQRIFLIELSDLAEENNQLILDLYASLTSTEYESVRNAIENWETSSKTEKQSFLHSLKYPFL